MGGALMAMVVPVVPVVLVLVLVLAVMVAPLMPRPQGAMLNGPSLRLRLCVPWRLTSTPYPAQHMTQSELP